jgi:hypothetical protein
LVEKARPETAKEIHTLKKRKSSMGVTSPAEDEPTAKSPNCSNFLSERNEFNEALVTLENHTLHVPTVSKGKEKSAEASSSIE